MLMRSEGNDAVVDCEDPMTVIACTTNTDACPAACRENSSDEPIVVKAGDLTVTAKAAEGRKALVATGGAVSDLDTLTFRTSEEVTINKVVLERYGYSSSDDVDAVWLEDQDGNVIAEEKSLSKDKVTLSIKKDYRTVDGTYTATVVVRLTGDNVGGTIGFKVVDADSTAKNLNLDNYTPYTYDMVTYAGNSVTVEIKGTQKNYNYEEGESYEIARLKVSAGKSIIYVKGFTLTNAGTLDMQDFLDKLTVTVDGENVAGLKYSINKDEQLVVSFDEMTIDMNKSKLFIISATLADFDDYGDYVAYSVKEDSDINAVEKKTGARLTVTRKWSAVSHAFNGGKIKLANTKLGKVDAAQWSEDVLVAEGTITTTEPISKIGFTLNTNNAYVTAVKMFFNGEEIAEWKNNKNNTFTFSNVEIEKSGKIQFRISIDDSDNATGTFTITGNFNKDVLSGARYDNSRDTVKGGDVAGAISFSQVTIQSARASLKNSLDNDAQFMLNETSDPELVFEGTYTAKKALINLNKFYIDGTEPNWFAGHDVTFYLYLEGNEVASTDSLGSDNEEWFKDVVVEAGKSINVRVRAVVEAYWNGTGNWTGLTLVLRGTDEFDKDVQDKSAELVGLKVAEKGSVKVEPGTAKNTVLKTSRDEVLAEFTVKSSNWESVDLTDLEFTIEGWTGADKFTKDDIEISVVDDFDDDCTLGSGGKVVCSDLKVSLPKTVTVSFNTKKRGEYTLTLDKVNDKTQTKSFAKRFENALVYIAAQSDKGDETVFTLGVKADSDYSVSNVKIYANGAQLTWTYAYINGDFSDGDELRVENGSKIQYIDGISYDWEDDDNHTGNVQILKSTYNDYFYISEKDGYAKVSKVSD